MSGRGRGVSNKPAWMTRQEGGPGGGGDGPPPPPPSHMDRDRERDPYGRDNYGRGPPPPRRYDDRRDRDWDRDRDFRDRGRYDDRNFRDRGRPFDDRRGGGRPFDDRRGGGRPFHNDRGGGGGRQDFRGGDGNRRPNRKNPGTIVFNSFDEEQQWVSDRRRKRLARPSKFDASPTPEQAAADAAMVALSNPAATDFSGINASDRNFSAVPQQTRHARRLYIGQLPPNVTEEELHVFFRGAIEQAIVPGCPGTVNGRLDEDPILSVYINHERRFCFLEFKTVEMTTACMNLDGIDIHGKGKVKVKRPNDYNPAMAPKVAPQNLPQLDTSRLGIVSGTVPDSPHKIFVGGLHYHLSEEQVLELLHAFGKVKAFHLVKNDPDSMTSKGYCFVEYADHSVTQVATLGLNGMDLGGGKMLTARVAGERSGGAAMPEVGVPTAGASPAKQGEIPPNANIVHGYDVEELVSAAMGQRPMPTAPMYLDSFGMPLTRLAPAGMAAAAATSSSTPARVPAPAGGGQSALDIANAALAAAYGGSPAPAAPTTRILVLSNMVLQEDLDNDEDYQALQEEVREECAKFGQLKGMQVPRRAEGNIKASAVLKIYLEYASVQDAQAAERELKGRKFGDNVVATSYFSESDYSSGKLH